MGDILGNPPKTVTPRYEAEIVSWPMVGDMKSVFTIRGHTAAELVEQFRSIELAERERDHIAYLPAEVFVLADFEATNG